MAIVVTVEEAEERPPPVATGPPGMVWLMGLREGSWKGEGGREVGGGEEEVRARANAPCLRGPAGPSPLRAHGASEVGGGTRSAGEPGNGDPTAHLVTTSRGEHAVAQAPSSRKAEGKARARRARLHGAAGGRAGRFRVRPSTWRGALSARPAELGRACERRRRWARGKVSSHRPGVRERGRARGGGGKGRRRGRARKGSRWGGRDGPARATPTGPS